VLGTLPTHPQRLEHQPHGLATDLARRQARGLPDLGSARQSPAPGRFATGAGALVPQRTAPLPPLGPEDGPGSGPAGRLALAHREARWVERVAGMADRWLVTAPGPGSRGGMLARGPGQPPVTAADGPGLGRAEAPCAWVPLVHRERANASWCVPAQQSTTGPTTLLENALGTVVGQDINPEMLAVARVAASQPNIEWLEGSAVRMVLPDATFDQLLCEQGLQFVPDKLAALAEMGGCSSRAGI
jgi:Methyltransferase domain